MSVALAPAMAGRAVRPAPPTGWGWRSGWRCAICARGGRALRLLAVCVFLGVAALAAVGSLSAAIERGLADRGREILGGDVAVELPLRTATPAERAAFARAGPVSELVRARAMVGRGDARVLAELKAVDARWPLYGDATVAGGAGARAALARGVLLAPELAERLGARAGDLVEVGAARLRVAGIIGSEPDRAGGGLQFGPTIIVPLAALPATAILQPGSLSAHVYRVALPPGVAPARALAAMRADAGGGSGWEVRDRGDGAPGLRRFVEQMGAFLTLTGLASLAVAGVGVGQGVGAYLAAKRGAVAMLKVLGAGRATVLRLFAVQIALVAGAAVLAGLVVGVAAPALFAALVGDLLPVAPAPGIAWGRLALAALYGLIVAAAFAIGPLAAAARTPPARLLRGDVDAAEAPPAGARALAAAAMAALVALAILTAGDPRLAGAFLGGVAALVGLLALLAAGARGGVAALPRPRSPRFRTALANLIRPGAPTTRLVVALGLGLTLFAALAAVETSLGARITAALPRGAPDLAFIDIPKEGIAPFRAMVARTAPGARVVAVPSLRGPVVAVGGVPATRIRAPEGAWVLRGDRGVSYADALPTDNALVSGRWWPRGYAGPPLVSMDADQGRLLGLRLGDRITVSVLGVDLEARIANFRRLNFSRASLQYMFVYNAAALEGAPHTWVATVALRGADGTALKRAAARELPTVSLIDLREALGQVRGLLGQILFAVRAAAAVTIAAGVAVLVGALAAGRRARTYDAVVLKMLGATRADVLGAAAIEYGLLAGLVGVVALVLGAAAAWAVVRYALALPFAPDWGAVGLTVAAGAVTVALGLAGSWRALSAPPARALRTL